MIVDVALLLAAVFGSAALVLFVPKPRLYRQPRPRIHATWNAAAGRSAGRHRRGLVVAP